MWHYFEVIDGQVLYVILYDFLNKFYINSTVLKYLDYLIIHLRMCLELWRRDRGHIPATLRWLIQDIWKGTCTFWPIGSIFAFFPLVVPQGSHLAFLLFNVFINNTKHCFQFGRILLFADDLKLHHKVSSHELQKPLLISLGWIRCRGACFCRFFIIFW